jgi:hypothetical protein
MLSSVGCSGAKRASIENDRIRAELLDQEDELTRLQQRITELEALVNGYEAGRDEASRAVIANTPLVTAIEIGRLSHVRDRNDDGTPDELVIYVQPTDGRGRFVQMVGDLSIHAALQPADKDAVTLGRVHLGPAEVREAYRSGLSGTHYTITVPLDVAGDLADQQFSAHVVYVDGRDGRRLEVNRGIALR